MSPRPLVVGLTGGLACGKSTVLAEFAALGAVTTDADLLAREALGPDSSLLPAVRARFGDGVFAGARIDRGALASRVFSDPEARRALEGLVHPEVIRREEEAIAAHAAAGGSIMVCDVPLLFEAGRAARFDRLVVVACPESTSVERAVGRGMTEPDARARVRAQMPIAAKVAQADYVIDSSAGGDGAGTIDRTIEQAREVYARLEEDLAAVRAKRPLPARRAEPAKPGKPRP